MVTLKITLHLEWVTSFHTTGNQQKWGADKALVRRYDGAYIVPATLLKGALRAQVEQLLADQTCKAPDPNKMCKDPNNPCLVCRVFGNPRYPSPLRFTDVVLLHNQEVTQIRSGVAISRCRRAAVPQHLYFTETTSSVPIKAQTTIEGYFFSQEAAKEAAALVALAANSLTALGAGRTRGLGWLAKIEARCAIDDQPIPISTLQEYWEQWLGGNK